MSETLTNDSPPSGPEEIWAILREISATQKEMKESQKEWEEEQRVRQMEFEEEQRVRKMELEEEQRVRQMEFEEEQRVRKMELEEKQKKHQEEMEELREIQKVINHNISKLGGRFGEMIEYMVVPNLEKKFREFGYVFNKTHQQTIIRDYTNNIITEADITLENSEKLIIIEVKSKPTTEDIFEHIERMEKIRSYADLHNDKRIYLGAIAGMVFNENEKAFALKKGFYVIEPSGNTFNITPPPGKAREW